MESCLSYIYPHTRVHSIIGILKTTAHNAFPVVTVDKNTQRLPQGNDFEYRVDSSNELFARTTTFSSLTSEQKLRRHLTSHGESSVLQRNRAESEHHPRIESVKNKRRKFKSESHQDDLKVTTSAPVMSYPVNEDNFTVQGRLMTDHGVGKSTGTWIVLSNGCACFWISFFYQVDLSYFNIYTSMENFAKEKLTRKFACGNAVGIFLSQTWISTHIQRADCAATVQ